MIPANKFDKPVSSRNAVRANISNGFGPGGAESRFKHKSDIKVVNQQENLKVSKTDIALGQDTAYQARFANINNAADCKI